MFGYHIRRAYPPDWKTAAEKSYRERWLPVARAKTLEEMARAYYETNKHESCALCRERDKYNLKCADCPLKYCEASNSESLWGKFISARFDCDTVAAHEAALAMCDRLCEIAEIEGEHRKSEVPDWWHKGLWVRGRSTALNIHKIGEQGVTMYEYWREPTLDDLSFTRNGVKMWAWEDAKGDLRVVDNTYTQSGDGYLLATKCAPRDTAMLKALIGDAPIIPWEQWKYLTEKEK